METPNDVLISGPRHLIIHGQFGNLQAKINQLEHMIKASETPELLPYLSELEHELVFLKEIYPALDGAVKYPNVVPGPTSAEPNFPETDWKLSTLTIRNRLRDMRALVDAAYTSYTHEGTIACHLKVMFDEAWEKAAIEAGIDIVGAVPF